MSCRPQNLGVDALRHHPFGVVYTEFCTELLRGNVVVPDTCNEAARTVNFPHVNDRHRPKYQCYAFPPSIWPR